MKSMKLTVILMRTMGLWHSSNKWKKFGSNLMLTLTTILMFYLVFLQAQELYYAKTSVKLMIYDAPIAVVILTETSKLLVFIIKRKKIVRLNEFVENKFWRKIYSREETSILNNCDELCYRMIGLYCILLFSCCSTYLIRPILGMAMGPDPKKEFPFPLRFGTILYQSPYFEMIFMSQIISTICIGICFTTFACYLFAINLSTAAQFNILNLHLQSLCDFKLDSNHENNVVHQKEAVNKLKDYIVTHQMLIDLTKEIEDLYCYVMLQQVFGSVSQISFCFIQILLIEATLLETFLSVQFLLSSVLQLYFYCYSSHVIFEASESVSYAMYSMKWFRITDTRRHKEFTQLFRIVTMRARRPCILSVGKFYPLTLTIFVSVLGRSITYYTVFRQFVH